MYEVVPSQTTNPTRLAEQYKTTGSRFMTIYQQKF